MPPQIEIAANCEIRTVIVFLVLKAGIHGEMEWYGSGALRGGLKALSVMARIFYCLKKNEGWCIFWVFLQI